VPYFQPISPSLIAARERPRMPWRVVARGAGLGAWGAVSAVAAWQLVSTVGTLQHPTVHANRAPAPRVRVAALHRRVRTPHVHDLLAVAVYRLLGFELPSGFRRPFLSQSFGEFFRSFKPLRARRGAVAVLFPDARPSPPPRAPSARDDRGPPMRRS